jgi:hypothetical protein
MQVGDIVHYVSFGTPHGEYTSKCRAAVVAEIPDDQPAKLKPHRVSLVVLNPMGTFFNQDIVYSPGLNGGTWHEREECGF